MRLFTIGHSNTPVEKLFERLSAHGIKIVVDVRSKPFSRYNPHFNRPYLQEALENAGFHYVWMGNVLGGVPEGPEFRTEGRIDYDKIRKDPKYQAGLEELLRGMEMNRHLGPATLMCSEADPTMCHRRRLVGADLVEREIELVHVLKDGTTEAEKELRGRREENQSSVFDFSEIRLDLRRGSL